MLDRPTMLDAPEIPKSVDQTPKDFQNLIRERVKELQPAARWKLATYEAAREKVVIDEVIKIRQSHQDLRETLGNEEEERVRSWEILQVLNDLREQVMRAGIHSLAGVPPGKFPPDHYIMTDYERMWLEHAIDMDSYWRDGNIHAFFRSAARAQDKMLALQKSFGSPGPLKEVVFSEISEERKAEWLGMQYKIPHRDTDDECWPLAQKIAHGSVLSEEEVKKWEREPEHRRREGEFEGGEFEYKYWARQNIEIMRLAQPEQYLYHLQKLDGEENFVRYQNIASIKELRARGAPGGEVAISAEDEAWYARQQFKLASGPMDDQFDDTDMEVSRLVTERLEGGDPEAFVQQIIALDKQASRTEGQEEFDQAFWDTVRKEYALPLSTDYATLWRTAEQHIAQADDLLAKVLEEENRVRPRFHFNKYQSVIMTSAIHYELAWRQLNGAATLARQELNELEEQLRALKATSSPDASEVTRLESAIRDSYKQAHVFYEQGIACLHKSADALSLWTGGDNRDAWNYQTRIGRQAKESSLAQHDLMEQYAKAREDPAVTAQELYHAKQCKVAAHTHELAALDAQIAHVTTPNLMKTIQRLFDVTDLFDAKTQEMAQGTPYRPAYRNPGPDRKEYERLRNYYHLRAGRQTVVARLEQAIDELNGARQSMLGSGADPSENLSIEDILPSKGKDLTEKEMQRVKIVESILPSLPPLNTWPHHLAGSRRVTPTAPGGVESFGEVRGIDEHRRAARAGGGSGRGGGDGKGLGGGESDGSEGGPRRDMEDVIEDPWRGSWQGFQDFVEMFDEYFQRERTKLENYIKDRPKLNLRQFMPDDGDKMWTYYFDTLEYFQDNLLRFALDNLYVAMWSKAMHHYKAIKEEMEAFRLIQRTMPDVLIQYFNALVKGDMTEEMKQYFQDHGFGGLTAESVQELVQKFSGHDQSMTNEAKLNALKMAFGVHMFEKWNTVDPNTQAYETVKEWPKHINEGTKLLLEEVKPWIEGLKTKISFKMQERLMKMVARRIAIATMFGGFGIGPAFMAMNGLGQSSFNQIAGVAMSR